MRMVGSGKMRRLGGVVTFRAIAVACVVSVCGGPVAGQSSLFDARFDEVRRASVAWDRRKGPDREVVDVVCLVPDLATFFEAVSAWDERHFFPVLIDDVEYTLKFLRAFRPARVVRLPASVRVAPITPGSTWGRAVAAVGRAWSAEGVPEGKVPGGDAVPAALGPVPPGVVVSSPDSPSLAGAVALAAGRFQPLVRWETGKHFADVLPADEARTLALGLETLLADRGLRYDRLGDDCDFVTLAGDYPYRYDDKTGQNAFDDLILRASSGGRRWAFPGRLIGDPKASAYRAMCSLFLSPASALLFNTYGEKDRPWSGYAMTAAADRLSTSLPVTHRNGERATLPGWHQAFDPVNRFGLILLNTHGGPTSFHLDGGGGHTSDIPESVPTVVLMIHSFSAASPDDPQTIAGRWLANGAFAFYGSMNEPFLQAFRPPGLVATFLAENLPVVTAVRKNESEVYGHPWRLLYFGDPLYRLKPVGTPPARLGSWGVVASWPAYGEFREPAPEEGEDRRLSWVLKTAIFRLQSGANPRQRTDLAATLLGIARDRLEPALRPLHDDLLVDTLLQAGRSPELIDRLTRIPPAGRSATLTRHLETAQTAALQRATGSGGFRQAMALWDAVARAPGSRDFVRTFTDRVGRLADSPARLADWRDRLRAAVEPSNSVVIEAERKRVEERRDAPTGR